MANEFKTWEEALADTDLPPEQETSQPQEALNDGVDNLPFVEEGKVFSIYESSPINPIKTNPDPFEDDEEGLLFRFITGKAGTGKTTLIKQQIEKDPSFGLLCATTGIAAVNLGTTTINSTFKYFDTASLVDKFIEGKVQATLARLAKSYRFLILDEASMLEGEALDVFVNAIEQVNARESTKRPIGLILTGDFGQLGPISTKEKKAKWAFEGECWDRFEEEGGTTFLTHVWRQESKPFVEALELARMGRGMEAEKMLVGLGAKFNSGLDPNFDGTTIMAKNEEVDSYNLIRLGRIGGKPISTLKKVEGKALGEWKQIPDKLNVKVGAYVMILVNKSLGYVDGMSIGFEYSNGDCGTIQDFNPLTQTFMVKLARNGEVVSVPPVTRFNESKHKPDATEELPDGFEPYYDDERQRWIYGAVTYSPIRVAYAVTTYKSQGLTLDKVQIDCRNWFMSNPNQLYVALSRARSVEGMRLVGAEGILGKRCKVDPKVLNWLKKVKEGM